jgi:hypothetical protein
LPLIVAGPILRRLTPDQVVLWLVTSRAIEAHIRLFIEGKTVFSMPIKASDQCVRVGKRAFIYLLDCRPDEPLPVETLVEYDLRIATQDGEMGLAELLPHLPYTGSQRPGFVVKEHLDHILHGSCRKPHHPGPDALVRVDEVLSAAVAKPAARPALLIMSGDQIYADDVAGPMLRAIHHTVDLLGLYPEELTGATVSDSQALFASPFCYYQRENLLPRSKANSLLRERFFRGTRKPIFTAASARNHLITLAEMTAMYFLVWSPVLWSQIALSAADMPDEYQLQYRGEQRHVEYFAGGLAKVQRALAHLPVYMIFDDHDVTDDWNLTRGWEESAYGHPFSRRIIGNAMIAYCLCQAWGNAPDRFDGSLREQVRRCFEQPGGMEQDALIERLLDFEQWHFSVPTVPKLVVLDTRTQRWWSESSAAKPSGLMDWEALSDLQQLLVGESSVVMVSPAPIFGVKLVEVVQRIFTFFGYALTVDAENWMAHSGSANVILNIFKHSKTPRNFVILSGDVHYSLVYDVAIRFRKSSPDIWQITCSGFKNEFPRKLLAWFDRLNRWLYGSRSPLNWFTKRRDMKVSACDPEGEYPRQLVNCSGVGRVRLNDEGVPVVVSVLPAEGGEIKFRLKR